MARRVGMDTTGRVVTAVGAEPPTMADLPAPADAKRLFAWRDLDGHSARAFIGDRARIDHPESPVLIEVLGLQYADGVTLRTIGVDGMPDEMTPALARLIAAALTQAADRIEAADGEAGPGAP